MFGSNFNMISVHPFFSLHQVYVKKKNLKKNPFSHLTELMRIEEYCVNIKYKDFNSLNNVWNVNFSKL